MWLSVSEVVVQHGRFERDEDGEEPKEDGCVQVKLVSNILPFAGIGRSKELGDKLESRRQKTADHARNPEDSPDNLKPDTEPHEIDTVDVSSLAISLDCEFAQQDRNKK